MVYLVGQIALCLVAAALAGGVIGWLLRQLRCHAAEQMLRRKLDEKSHSLGIAKEETAALRADLTVTQRRLETQTHRLESQIRELAPLPDIVRRRETTIGRLQNELRSTVDKLQSRVDSSCKAPSEPTPPFDNERLAPAQEESDDLTKIRGIGPVMERMLIGLGIRTYRQIAEFGQRDIERVAAAIETFPNRIIRDDWIGGAKREYAKMHSRVTMQTR